MACYYKWTRSQWRSKQWWGNLCSQNTRLRKPLTTKSSVLGTPCSGGSFNHIHGNHRERGCHWYSQMFGPLPPVLMDQGILTMRDVGRLLNQVYKVFIKSQSGLSVTLLIVSEGSWIFTSGLTFNIQCFFFLTAQIDQIRKQLCQLFKQVLDTTLWKCCV